MVVKNIREVDINEYMPILIDLVENGNTVPLLISGNSMSPFLVHHRDTIFISKPNSLFKRGDIVFFRRLNGDYVVHRIHHINNKGEYYIIGDGQTLMEGPVMQSQIFGIVKKVIRKGKLINEKSVIWFFFEKIWIRLIIFRKIIVNLIAKIKY